MNPAPLSLSTATSPQMRKNTEFGGKVAVIGNGYVGKAVRRFFGLRYETVVYDPAYLNGVTKADVNACGLGVVCVPTPSAADGTCDISIVEEVVDWLETPLILLHSTVRPGTTEQLRGRGKRVVFSPEYIGESSYFTSPEHPHPTDIEKHTFFIFGGDPKDTSECVDWFAPIVGPSPFFYQVDATTAEVIKYWENCWGAMKVTFANEMYAVCEALGVDYWKAREGWALDSRVEKMHSAVFKAQRGYGGKCLPKDVAGLVAAARAAGYEAELLAQVMKSNARFRDDNL